MSEASIPGEILYGDGEIVLNAGRIAVDMEVTNTGDRAIQVGSHFHFFEANRALRFRRHESFGMRLDIPSGTSVRFEAGQTHRVSLIAYGGTGRIIGFNALVQGDERDISFARAESLGFIDVQL